MISTRHILKLFGIFSLLISYSVSYANINGRWIQHPAAALRTPVKQSQVERIFEGEKYVYFSIRGNYFDRNQHNTVTYDINFDPIEIFRYDKSLPWNGNNIKALAQAHDLSGSLVIVMNYSVDKRMLALIYEDRTIDFIYEDGTIVTSKALKDATIPSLSVIPYSISFDEGNPLVYVACSFGYAAININSGELESLVRLDKPVAWANRVGENMVVSAGSFSPSTYSTSTYIFPVDKVPSSLNSPVAGLSNLQVIMPLSDKSFAALGPGASDLQCTIMVYVVDGNSAKGESFATITADDASSWRFRHMFRSDGYVAPSKNGYVFFSSDNIFFIDKKTDIDYSSSNWAQDFKNAAFFSVSKSGLETNEKNSKSASFDGKRVWFYTYDTPGIDQSVRGFYFRDLSDGNWSDKSVIAAPNAPTSTVLVHGEWNPEYGLLFRGPGTYFNNQETDRDRFCGLKNGSWTDYSFSATNTKYVAATSYAKNINYDPLNPSWIWGCSNRIGLHRMDLSDPSDYFALGSKKYPSYETTYPGYYAIYESEAAWSSLINFANVDFDSEGRMWFSRFHTNESFNTDYEGVLKAYVPLYYYSKEERLSLGKGSRPVLHEIRIPGSSSFHNAQLLVLKNRNYSNYIAFSHCQSPVEHRLSFIFDHNGTPENVADDRIAYFEDLIDENGEKISESTELGLFEDVDKGELWLLTVKGPIIMNPSEILAGSKTVRRFSINKREGASSEDNPFEQIAINCVIKDNQGRKWMSSDNGLYVVSSDNKELLGHYTTANSALPSDEINGIVLNQSSGSIFVMTTRGLAEFQPEGSRIEAPASTHLSIWPSNITPDYKGYVNIDSAIDGYEYIVSDEKGSQIVSLGKPVSGMLQWDGRSQLGERVPAGKYNISRRNINEKNTVIVLDHK